MISHQETAGGGITFYVNMKLEYMELFLKMGEELTDSLNVRITGRAGTRDIIVGVCCRPPDEEGK